MLIKIVPQESYWDLTHDIVIDGKLNDPVLFETWDWVGGSYDAERPTCTFNGSLPISVDKDLGPVIRNLIKRVKQDRVKRRVTCPCLKEKWSDGTCQCASMTLIDLSPD